jgi:hypothetical protein
MRDIDLHTEVEALFTAPTLVELAAVVGQGSPREVQVPENLIPDPAAARSTSGDVYL